MYQPIRGKNKQKGQGIMEYIILTGLIGIFCLFAVKNFGKTMKKKVESMQAKIQKEIRM